jgi:hypothetical protein
VVAWTGCLIAALRVVLKRGSLFCHGYAHTTVQTFATESDQGLRRHQHSERRQHLQRSGQEEGGGVRGGQSDQAPKLGRNRTHSSRGQCYKTFCSCNYECYNLCREKGSLLSFVYIFGHVACWCCQLPPK